MDDNYLGTIFSWASKSEPPEGFMFCDGRLLDINGPHEALFHVIGNKFGGDGETNFAIPDLRGRTPVGCGQAHYKSTNIAIGEKGGAKDKKLDMNTMPSHSHKFHAFSDKGTTPNPKGNLLANTGTDALYRSEVASEAMQINTIDFTGQAETASFSIMQSYLVVNFIICVEGFFP